MNSKKINLKVFGINSGMGVSLFPFRKWVIGNLETRKIFHVKDDKQWKLNFLDIPLYKSWGEFSREKIKNVDLVVSSPDCGSSSIFRLSRAKKYGNQKDNQSLTQFFESLQIIKPKFFYFENLPGLFKNISKKEFKSLCVNYRLVIHICSVAEFGNSQFSRKRLIIIGIRKDLPKKIKKYFRKPFKVYELKYCGDIYGDLMANEEFYDHSNIREEPKQLFSIYGGKKITGEQAKIEWMTRLKDKKRWWIDGGNFKTAPGVYRNLENDYPATARKANRQYDHEGNVLSPRQLARVQGVPDKFKLLIDLENKTYSINKTRTVVTKTPPMEISIWVLKCLKKSKKLW